MSASEYEVDRTPGTELRHTLAVHIMFPCDHNL